MGMDKDTKKLFKLLKKEKRKYGQDMDMILDQSQAMMNVTQRSMQMGDRHKDRE